MPKGLETRTPIRPSVDATVRQLDLQTAQLTGAAGQEGFRLAVIGRNPRRDYRPQPPYNSWELRLHERRPEYAAPEAYMVGCGPDLNLSHPDWAPDRVLDVARKLTVGRPRPRCSGVSTSWPRCRSSPSRGRGCSPSTAGRRCGRACRSASGAAARVAALLH